MLYNGDFDRLSDLEQFHGIKRLEAGILPKTFLYAGGLQHTWALSLET